MNVRPRKSASKYSFEPKIPQSQELFEVEEEQAAKKEFMLESQGEYTPRSMGQDTALEHPFILGEQEGLLLTLPRDISMSKIVVYEDGSCGLKIGDEVFPMSARFVGESLVVEHKEMAYGIGSAKFQLTPQLQEFKK
ncbi:hypothetical protein KMI_14g19570 [Encephalitozoon hellem]|nr:hypothetical protein KMI_14g19570 [Encephalitozoon hellem]